MKDQTIKLCFECDSNSALLMMAFHDIIRDIGPENSIAAADNFEWILDELFVRSTDYLEYITSVNGDTPGYALSGVVALETARRDGNDPEKVKVVVTK